MGTRRPHHVLEAMLLDQTAQPTDLPFPLLQQITHDFSDDQEIGMGGFAVVYKGILQNGVAVAVKKLKETFDVDERTFNKEVQALMKTKHKNVVRFLGYCADTQGKGMEYEGKFVMADLRNRLLCFEYLPNGSLDKYITDPSEGLEWRDRYEIIKGIAHGLHYLHDKHILHLDLKPANILLDATMTPKIADFGLSRCFDENQTRTVTVNQSGTVGYMAPELFNNSKLRIITLKLDIYSLGVIIMEILTGRRGLSERDYVVESWKNRLEFDMLQVEQVRVCTEIGLKCINADPVKRPSTLHIIEMLGHPSVETGTNNTTATSSPVQFVSLLDSVSSLRPGPLLQPSPPERPPGRYQPPPPPPLSLVQHNRLPARAGMQLGIGPHHVLERMLLDQTAQPAHLPLSLLQQITDDFSDDKKIGIGRFGVVYKGILQNGMTVAVKKLSQTFDMDERKFNQEVEVLMKTKHKNVVHFLGYCSDTQGKGMEYEGKFVTADLRNRLLCFEYLPNGSLDKYIKTDASRGLEWEDRYEIIKGIAQGLHYLHDKCILHLDLNPTNILIDATMTPKIAGFGPIRWFDENQSRTFTSNLTGTVTYLAPEAFASFNIEITFKSDIYSLGVIIMEILTGRRGYAEIEDVVESWKNRLELDTLLQVERVRVCTEIGLQCMNADPAKRPSTVDIIDRLGHSCIDEAESEAESAENLPRASAEVLGSSSTYGKVYKASLEDGSLVAVKKLRQNTTKGPKQFKAEATALGKVRHPNLLPLRAYHWSSNEKLLVFDYMHKHNGILSAFMHDRAIDIELNAPTNSPETEAANDKLNISTSWWRNITNIFHRSSLRPEKSSQFNQKPAPSTPVDWATRMTIAKGTARGLAYLHDHMGIVHGNLTSSNVLFDADSCNLKVAEFGLFRLITEEANSNVLADAGARGYRAPELSKLEEASAKTDVYSLGVILLELLTGRSPSNMDLPRWVRSIAKPGWTHKLFDLELMRDAAAGGPEGDEFMATLNLALQCVVASPSVRPEAREVLRQLEEIRPRPEEEGGGGAGAGPSDVAAAAPVGSRS